MIEVFTKLFPNMPIEAIRLDLALGLKYGKQAYLRTPRLDKISILLSRSTTDFCDKALPAVRRFLLAKS